jgi:hypothetical protein
VAAAATGSTRALGLRVRYFRSLSAEFGSARQARPFLRRGARKTIGVNRLRTEDAQLRAERAGWIAQESKVIDRRSQQKQLQDTNHPRWNEIHPVSRIIVIPKSARSAESIDVLARFRPLEQPERTHKCHM